MNDLKPRDVLFEIKTDDSDIHVEKFHDEVSISERGFDSPTKYDITFDIKHLDDVIGALKAIKETCNE